MNLLDHAEKFGFGKEYISSNKEEFRYKFHVEFRGYDKWAVTCGNYCYYKKEGFVYEPFPSSRTDEFLKNTRFTLDEAVEIAERFSENI